MKSLKFLTSGLSLQHALRQSSRKRGIQLKVNHARILLIISTRSIFVNRNRIQQILRKRSCFIKYAQMNNAIGDLKKCGFIAEDKNNYSITNAGEDLLKELDARLRGLNWEGIKIETKKRGSKRVA